VDIPGKESRGGAHPSSGASVERWGGAARWRAHEREGRQRLQLTLGAAGQDERGEGGPKSENDDGLVGLTVRAREWWQRHGQ
jgi:hypothetical protein